MDVGSARANNTDQNNCQVIDDGKPKPYGSSAVSVFVAGILVVPKKWRLHNAKCNAKVREKFHARKKQAFKFNINVKNLNISYRIK